MAFRPRGRLALAFGLAALLHLALLLGLPRLASGAAPTNLFVLPGGSGTACSQAAPCMLATALSRATDGDSLYLGAGRYTGSGGAVITVTRGIHLLCGWDGAATGTVRRDPANRKSIIDGENQRRGILMNLALPLEVDGCVIEHGVAAAAPWRGFGGGLLVSGATVRITGNEIRDCVGSPTTDDLGRGGGAYLVNAHATGLLEGNVFHHNSAAQLARGFGGGLAISQSPGMVVRNNLFLTNTASITNGRGYGGGLWLEYSNHCQIQDNEFRGNVGQAGTSSSVGSRGGAMELDQSNWITITENSISGNIASRTSNGAGGGVELWGCDDVLFRGNLLTRNTGSTSSSGGTGRGGGISAYGSLRLTIEANQILSNTAGTYSGLGGGLYLSRNTGFMMTNNIVAGNGGSQEGGGMAFETGTLEPVTGTLLHNTLINNNSSPGAGGYAIHVNEPYVILNGTNNLFSGHTWAVYGEDDSTVTLTRTLFYANTLGDVGGSNVANQTPISGQNPKLDGTYHLMGGSPAINAGVPAGVTWDMDDDIRPMGGGFDIGSDEFYQYTEWRQVSLPLIVRIR